ncbi:MAG: hybrid sensor histidine kinase/response regulator [Ruminococcus sp.]|nr:hybrid sensor histidine kinase/response regulator [Ruminococcus sp.]
MKEEYFAQAMHGLRTPVNSIVGLTVLARRSTDIEEVNAYLSKIEEASYQLINTVNNLSDMYQMDNEKMYLESNDFDLEDLLDSVLDMVYVRADTRDVMILLDLKNVFRVKITSDRFKLAKVMYNILSNAIDFCERGDKVKVKLALLSPRELSMTVSADCKGLTAEKIEAVFGTSTGTEMTALPMCRKIISMMGGELIIESDIEKGVKFSFTVNVHSHRKGDNELLRSFKALKMRFLAIDNHREVIEYLAEVMTEIEGKVTPAETLAAGAKFLMNGDEFSGIILSFDMIANEFKLIIENVKKYIDEKKIILFVRNSRNAYATELCERYGYRSLKFITVPILPSKFIEQIGTEFGLQGSKSFRQRLAPDFSGKNILMVDDHELSREITAGILESTHAGISFASNGKEAVELYAMFPEKYNAILMDVQMPVMDGLTATRTIRAIDTPAARAIPIIAMTANIFDLDKKSCYDAGMSRYISKPISVRELYRILEEVL